jgi:hypothetical protein
LLGIDLQQIALLILISNVIYVTPFVYCVFTVPI